MGRVNQVPPRSVNCRGRGTEGSTFGALRRLPVEVAAFLASGSLSVPRPEGST